MTSVTLLKSVISHLGGLEKYTLRLAKAFENRGCDVTLLTTGPASSLDSLTSIRIHSHTFSSKLSVSRVAEFDSFCSSALKKMPSSIIFGLDRNRHQTHIRAGNGAHAGYLNRRKQTEGIIKRVSFAINPLHRLILSIEKTSFESPSLQILFTNSSMVKEEVLTYYNVDPSKIKVVHNGVEWEEMKASFEASFTSKESICAHLGLDPHLFHWLFIGNNFARKGLSELFDALALLPGKDFHLSIIGTDKDEKFYRDKAQKLGLSSKVTFFGGRRDVAPFYQVADCLVIPSHYDPFANVTVEALAMGLFVVSSKTNGASEVLTKDSGNILEDLHDRESFAHALQQALLKPKKLPSAILIRDSIRHLDFSNQLPLMVDLTLNTKLS